MSRAAAAAAVGGGAALHSTPDCVSGETGFRIKLRTWTMFVFSF